MNRLRLKSQEGFTLIELLVVIAIIGILAAIAIPQFAAYRKRAFAADVKSNLRNAAVAEEAYFVDHNAYDGGNLAGTGSPVGFNKSATVTVDAGTPSASLFTLTGTDTRCTGDTWLYRSKNGSIDDTGVTTCK